MVEKTEVVYKSIIDAGKDFTDNDFPPNDHSLGKRNGSYSWKRAKDVYNGEYNVFKEINVGDIQQGELGDCYFLCSMSAVAEYPERISNLFLVKEKNSAGCYAVRLYISGSERTVVLDDYFPYNNPCNSWAYVSSTEKEIWVNLLEKAWAKVNGSYESVVGGDEREGLTTLTGAPSLYLDHDNTSAEEVWKQISTADQKGYIMACGGRIDSGGIISGHAYSLLQALEVDHNGSIHRIVKLRNPWGREEWHGDWSDNDSCWTHELREKLHYYPNDEGEFYIGFDSYYNLYGDSVICKCDNSYVRSELIVNSSESFVAFQIYEPTTAFLSIYQKMPRLNSSGCINVPYLVSELYRYENMALKKIGNQAKTDVFGEVSREENLSPGVYVLQGHFLTSPNRQKYLCFVAYSSKAIDLVTIPGKSNVRDVVYSELLAAIKEKVTEKGVVAIEAPTSPDSPTSCANGHPLVFKSDDEGEFTCDRCRKNYLTSQGHHHCASCNYDACTKCLAPPEAEKKPEAVKAPEEAPKSEAPKAPEEAKKPEEGRCTITHCPAGHLLLHPRPCMTGNMICAYCGEIRPANGRIWECKACDYCICEFCRPMEKSPEIPPPTQITKVSTCRRGHPLQYGSTPDRGFPFCCDLCRRIGNTQLGLSLCMLCKFKVCMMCTKTEGSGNLKMCPSKPSLTTVCNAMHPLSISTYSSIDGVYICKKCRAKKNCKDGRYCCLVCKYDICQSCRPLGGSEEAKAEKGVTKKCPRQHVMTLSKVEYPISKSFRCRGCSSTAMCASERWWCQACSYDICKECADATIEYGGKKSKKEKSPTCTKHNVLPARNPEGKFICGEDNKEASAADGKFFCVECGKLLCKKCKDEKATMAKLKKKDLPKLELPTSGKSPEESKETPIIDLSGKKKKGEKSSCNCCRIF